MFTTYGEIEDNSLQKTKIRKVPEVQLPNYLKKLYIHKIDSNSSHILVRIDGKWFKLKSCYKTPIKEVECFKSTNSNHIIALPKTLNPMLSYFLGYFFADGALKNIYKSKAKSGHYEYKMKVGDEHLIQTEFLQNLFREIFGLNLVIRMERLEKGQRYSYIEMSSKVIYRFLTGVFDLPSGSKTSIMKVPKIILDAPQEIRMWFVRGVFDADGDTRATELYKFRKLPTNRIKLRMKNPAFLRQIKNMLIEDFGVEFKMYDFDSLYPCIQVHKISDLTKLYEKYLFIHPIKAWRLSKFISLKRDSSSKLKEKLSVGKAWESTYAKNVA